MQRLAYDLMQVEERVDVEEDDDHAISSAGGGDIVGQDHRQTAQCGRKRVRNPDSWKKKHVKRKGLRQNAPQVTVDTLKGENCCKKACVQHGPVEHLVSL